MCKKIAVFALGLAAVAAVWNTTRIVAASERVRDAWITSQRKQTLEDWEIHFDRRLRQMQQKVDDLDKQARGEALAAELASMKSERLATRVERGEQMVGRFRAQLEQDGAVTDRFVFGGQEYDRALAAVQLERFETELDVLGRQATASTARVEAHNRAAAQFRKAAKELRVRVAELRQRGRKLALRRQLLTTQRELRELEQRDHGCAFDETPLRQLDALIEVAEESLDEVEARQRIERRARPAKTLSLDEGVSQQPF